LTGLPSGFICAFKVMSMCTVFGSTARWVVTAVHTLSHDFFQPSPMKSSPSIGARSIMPSMNSSGMPRSVRVGILSARRPYHENAILTATSGRVAATLPAGIGVRWDGHRSAVVISGSRALTNFRPPTGSSTCSVMKRPFGKPSFP